MAKITSAKALEHARDPGMHRAGDNLYLAVSSTGARSWIVRYAKGSRLVTNPKTGELERKPIRHDHGLGSAKYLSLAERGRRPTT